MSEVHKKIRVFISYSRKDKSFPEKLRKDLNSSEHECFLDKHDIFPGEPWKKRLTALIENADVVIFCMSPSSVSSSMCDWELNEAERCGKRILPVVCKNTPDDSVPSRLKRLNYIFLRPNDDYMEGISNLRAAIDTDITWIREHTRLGVLALRWDNDGRPNSQLLRGNDVDAAEQWLAKHPSSAPKPTELEREWIVHSRQSATRRQRRWVTGSLLVATVAATLAGLAIGAAYLATLQLREAVAAERRANQWADRRLFTISLAITEKFEGRREFDSVRVDRFGGLTIGNYVGWNQRTTRLNQLLLKMYEASPKEFVATLAGGDRDLARALLDHTAKEKGGMHSADARFNFSSDEWKERFKAAGNKLIFQRTQLDLAYEDFNRNKIYISNNMPLLQSERGVALMLDSMVLFGQSLPRRFYKSAAEKATDETNLLKEFQANLLNSHVVSRLRDGVRRAFERRLNEFRTTPLLLDQRLRLPSKTDPSIWDEIARWLRKHWISDKST